MNVHEMPVKCDLSEMTFERAVGMARVMPDAATVYCSTASACVAYKLVEKFHCQVIMIPPEMIAGQFYWAVVGPSDTVWSPGV